ncbi:MAG: hypothetical protein B6245_05755 [Desulfobacteraceae bacterium 4572_88]|nr:MAG: hypothetical protein B6245_05755 [Desulfobacteraceae bacterium 4572_88]
MFPEKGNSGFGREIKKFELFLNFSEEDAEGFVCPYAVTTVTWAGDEPDADEHENDNSSGKAGHITLNDTVLQHRSFHRADDADWLKFLALPGKSYNIRILSTGAACDPVAEILRNDGVALLSDVERETGPDGAQHIGFTCKASDIRFVRLRNADSGVFGKDVSYDLEIYRPAASDTGTIQGVVTDISGNPIPDASLMTSDGGTDLSRNDGTYTVITPASVSHCPRRRRS